MQWKTIPPHVPGDSWTVEIPEARDPQELIATVRAAVAKIAADPSFGDAEVRVWIPDVADGDNERMAEAGFQAYRDLWQLRVDLPVAASSLETRPFTPDDASAFLAVNNRAFSWHPEQSGMTIEDLEQRQQEVWYRAADFRLHDIDGRLAGFNWLKVHRPEEGATFDPPMGEIYVIAVDPDFHGRGLGTDLALAGLGHLAAGGLTRAMLYVESDNHAANKVYERIGFTRAQVNRAFTNRPPDS